MSNRNFHLSMLLGLLGDLVKVFLRAFATGLGLLLSFMAGGAILGGAGALIYGHAFLTMVILGAVAGFVLAIVIILLPHLNL